MAAQPLAALPAQRMTRLAARVAARLRRGPPWPLVLQGETYHLRWLAQAAPPYTTVVRIRIGAAEWACLVDDLALTPELAPEVLGTLDDAGRRVCVAYAFADLIDALSHAAHSPVSVIGVQYQRVVQVPASALGWVLEHPATGVQRQGALVPDDDHAWQVLDRLTSHWSAEAPPASQAEDAEWVRFVLGSCRISPAQSAALRPGWVLIVQQDLGTRGITVVDADGASVAAFALEPGARQARKWDGESGVKVVVVQDGEASAAQQPIDDVAVALGFEVGGAMVSLQALRALAPGDVLELDRPIEDCTVQIRSGDKTVGTGELLDLDGVLGVRILTLNGRD